MAAATPKTRVRPPSWWLDKHAQLGMKGGVS